MSLTIPTVAITATGISAPSYASILTALQNNYLAIYGSDSVLTPNTQDGQLLAVFAQAMYDIGQTAVAVYQAYSPLTAQGVGLSSVVKINGIRRLVPSNSTANITIGGVTGTVLNNCIVGDNANLGTQWTIPNGTTIPNSGLITVTATCTTAGAVTAGAGTLVDILTPLLGWQTATNPGAAVPGAPTETDSALRQRQAASTGLAAETVLGGIIAAVANISGVDRYAAYENDTGTVNLLGIPAHSISVVVEGGNAVTIAQTIEQKKAPGTGTYGTTSELVYDPAGVPITINFYALTGVPLTVVVNLRALTGYVATTAALIQSSIAAYLENFSIGELVYASRLYAAAALYGDAATTATGMTQAALDALSNTYTVYSLTVSRAANVADTTVTGGPYAAGVVNISVATAADLYVGCPIGITLDNATTLNTTVAAIPTSTSITLANAVPVSRQILNNANLYMTSDVKINFYEAAQGVAANVTVNQS